MSYLTRRIEGRLDSLVERHPVVVLTGARQTGKTTLLRERLRSPDWRYVTLDDLDDLELALTAPADLLAGSPRIVIDEVQKAPALLSAIKRVVDEDRERRVVLSGSANLALMRGVSESLAGRAVYLTLAPLTLGERLGLAPSSWLEALFEGKGLEAVPKAGDPVSAKDWQREMWRGGLPAVLDLDDEGVTQWRDGYERTYLERDVLRFASISDVIGFRRTMRALALQAGGLLNLASLSREVGLGVATISRYLDVLEVSMLGGRLAPYTVNRKKRLVRTPKMNYADAGLACHLVGIRAPGDLTADRLYPHLLESFVIQQLAPATALLRPEGVTMFWRTTDNKEVDVVIERAGRLVALEVKASHTVNAGMATGLRALRDEAQGRFVAGLMVYSGDEVRSLGDRLLAVPIGLLPNL
jgi:uncharacterized protein